MKKDSEDKRKAGYDRELGMNREITRRDFLNGMLVSTAGMAAVSWLPGLLGAAALDTAEPQNQPGYYPPALTGMRGSHEGSYQVAHALRDGTFWDSVGEPIDTRETYDLVVVGGGISGLAAAYFYRKQAGSSASILIVDRPGGRLLLANGGTLSIESPFPYSKEARGLMHDLGIHPAELEKRCVDRTVYKGQP